IDSVSRSVRSTKLALRSGNRRDLTSYPWEGFSTGRPLDCAPLIPGEDPGIPGRSRGEHLLSPLPYSLAPRVLARCTLQDVFRVREDTDTSAQPLLGARHPYKGSCR